MITETFEKLIANYLVQEGIGLLGGTTDWAIYYSYLPDKPLNCIAVFDHSTKPIHALVGYSGQFFSIHIRIRGVNYHTLTSKTMDIYNLLKFDLEIPVTGGVLKNIKADTGIMNLGKVKINSAETGIMGLNFSGLYVE